MKNLIVSIGTCLLSCTLFSCNENAIVEEVDNGGGILQTKSAIDAPYSLRADGSLSFRNVDDYFAVTDSLIKLNDEDFVNWENSIGFVSYRSYVDKLTDEVEEAINDSNSDKVSSLLNDYAKFISLDEDSVVKPIIKSETYRRITNKDGVFYIGYLKNVVDETSIYAVDNGMTRSVSPKLSYVITNNMRGIEEPIYYKEYLYTKSDNTKRVITTCSIVKNVALTDAQGNSMSSIQFQIFVDGKRNKRGWKHYSTAYFVKDITCLFKNIPLSTNVDGTVKTSGDFLFEHPGQDSAGESKNHTFVYNLGKSVKNYTTPIQHAACIHYKAMTRGTLPEGIGYNYSDREYGIDENHNKNLCAEDVCSLHSNVHSGN